MQWDLDETKDRQKVLFELFEGQCLIKTEGKTKRSKNHSVLHQRVDKNNFIMRFCHLKEKF